MILPKRNAVKTFRQGDSEGGGLAPAPVLNLSKEYFAGSRGNCPERAQYSLSIVDSLFALSPAITMAGFVVISTTTEPRQ